MSWRSVGSVEEKYLHFLITSIATWSFKFQFQCVHFRFFPSLAGSTVSLRPHNGQDMSVVSVSVDEGRSLFYFLSRVVKKLPKRKQKKRKKFGTLHDYACHPCAGGHANLLCIVPILVDAPAEAGTSFLGRVPSHKEALVAPY